MDEGHGVIVVGGGIVGLATARALRRRLPSTPLTVLEKEGVLAAHQTGRNSGVIHAGVYYRPGSEKARLCTAGRLSMVEFCRERGVPYEVCGKLVVATEEDEVVRLRDLAERCRANGVPTELLGPAGIRDREPEVAGVAALHVAVTGIVDYGKVSAAMARELQDTGVEIRTGVAVLSGRTSGDRVHVETTVGSLTATQVVNCGGLQADRLARAFGARAATDVRIVPFRGEYFELEPNRSHLVRGLIYPVPDPRFPFLGVHLTRGIDGHVHAGPNAVLALAREGYSWGAIDRHDLAEIVRFRGFRHLARRYWRYGATEMVRSLSRTAFTRTLQRLVPAVRREDLRPAPAGVRAQAVRADGTLVDDFLFEQVGPVLHVLNAPSPAATASIEIGRVIAQRLLGPAGDPA